MIKFYKKNGTRGDISGYCSGVDWSGQDAQVSRTCSIEIINAPNDKHVIDNLVTVGDTIIFSIAGYGEIFRGEAVNITKKDSIGTVTYECKDYMYHLLRSNASYKFKNKTPQYITKKVCADAGVAVGELPNTKVTIPKLIADDWTMYKTIMQAWHKAYKQTGNKYMLRMSKNKIEVVKKGEVVKNFYLSRNVNLTACERTESLESMINRVAIYSEKGKKIGTISNSASIKKYGIFQATYTKEKNVNANKHAKSMFIGVEQSITVTVIDPPISAIAGNGIRVYDDETGLHGLYWIDEDKHSWKNGIHTAELTLRFKNIMDTGG